MVSCGSNVKLKSEKLEKAKKRKAKALQSGESKTSQRGSGPHRIIDMALVLYPY